MVYIKSTLLSSLARAGRLHGQPFFTQNAHSANTTALTLVKPKLALATERSFFSSWQSTGYNASSVGPAVPQQALLAACNDDSRDKLRRSRGRTLLPMQVARRYSTGTRDADANLTPASSRTEAAISIEPAETEASALDDESASLPSSLARLGTQASPWQIIDEYDRLVQQGSTLNAASYELLFSKLAELIKLEQWRALSVERVLSFYTNMMDSHISPSVETYEAVLSILLARHGEIRTRERTVDDLDWLKNTKQKAFADMASLSLAVAEEEDATGAAIEIFNASISARQPIYARATIESLLFACEASGRAAEAVSIYDYVTATGLERSPAMYSSLITTFSAAGDMDGAIECFNQYKADIAQLPNHDHFLIYTNVVQAFFNAGLVKEGLQFFDRAVRARRGNVRPIHHTKIVRMFIARGEASEGYEFLKQRLPAKLRPDEAICFLLQDAARQDDVEKARKYFQMISSPSRLVKPWTAAGEYLMALVRNGHLREAQERLMEWAACDVTLAFPYVSYAMSSFIAAGQIEASIQIFRLVAQRKLIVDLQFSRKRFSLCLEIFFSDLEQANALDASTFAKLAPTLIKGRHLIDPALAEALVARICASGEVESLVEQPTLVLAALSIALTHNKTPSSGGVERFVRILPSQSALLVKGAILLEHAQPGTLTADVLDSAKNLARALSLELELIELHDLSKVPLMPTPPASEVSFKHLPAVPSEVAIFVGEGSPLIDWKTSQMIKTIATAQSNNAAVVTSTLTKTLTDCLSSSSPGYIAPWVVLLATNTLAKDSSATALSTLVPLMERNFLALAKAPDLEAAAKARLHDSLVAPFSDMHALAEARQCLTKVQELGFCPSSKAYASIIARLDENASTDTASEALTLFNDAIARGVRPDTYLYNTVIAKLAKARRFDEALQLFQDLKASGLTPNGVTYGTIINACCRVGNTELAESLFEEMELDPRVSSRIAPYNTLMQHFVRVRADRTQALHYWHRLLAQNLAPSAHSYRLLIEAYGHLDPVDPDGVKRVLSMMRAKRMPILPVHHAAVIGMYGKSGDLRTAQSYFGKLDQLPNYARDPVLHQALLEACVHNKDQAGMVDVIDKMREQGMTLDAYLANVIIEGYANGGSLAEARTFFDSLKEGTGPQHKEPSTYAAMAKAYLAHHCKDEALAIVEQARRQTYPPAVLHKIESLVQE